MVMRCAAIPALIGLAADQGSLWSDLRVGELKARLAVAIGDDEAMLRREQNFFGIAAPGLELNGSELHQRLLAAYGKQRH